MGLLIAPFSAPNALSADSTQPSKLEWVKASPASSSGGWSETVMWPGLSGTAVRTCVRRGEKISRPDKRRSVQWDDCSSAHLGVTPLLTLDADRLRQIWEEPLQLLHNDWLDQVLVLVEVLETKVNAGVNNEGRTQTWRVWAKRLGQGFKRPSQGTDVDLIGQKYRWEDRLKSEDQQTEGEWVLPALRFRESTAMYLMQLLSLTYRAAHEKLKLTSGAKKRARAKRDEYTTLSNCSLCWMDSTVTDTDWSENDA